MPECCPIFVFHQAEPRVGALHLLCISKYLPKGVVWDKVTITFDNTSGPPAMKFDEATRKP
jgi:hypothetical protein